MDWLKNFRYKQNLTISQMAIELGVSKSLYEKVEYGDRNPSANFIKKFKDRFPDEDINIFFNSK
ncbi:helix-turn-helix domain-containing protein [Zhenhengia yiwuensis]|uniref:Helix-turn-helix transcriptional regulator n=1 Tax=Zhenhengia yiwuensis TaxID=2763666 RepID=A0A926EIV7_9FIRM|nr:helix-turn-helix transcriptional regulator [Zhenhengia yiwuensis]MBC8581209.1 helix-turn-helix transcriptional regulator [Zhenhengia yiwuensis]